jgi:hypothetical protein
MVIYKFCSFRYLASGSLLRHVASVYRVSKQHMGSIIDQTCSEIYESLKVKYMPTPNPEFWVSTANKFNGRWNFPNVLGAVDGKHIAIKCPTNASSLFYNHKVALKMVNCKQLKLMNLIFHRDFIV